jgi:hypothetical protein
MKEKQVPGNSNAPNLGTATPKFLELFDHAVAKREDLKKWIAELSSKPNLTIRDRLFLALHRHQLSFSEPPLPAGVSLTGMHLWEYWDSHWEELPKYWQFENEIRSYLEPPETLHNRALSNKLAMMDLIQQDSLTFLAYYPVIDKMFGKLETKPGRGRPATRRLTAVRALQMQIDNKLDLETVTQELCDCGKKDHSECCKQQMRQSINSLRELLRKCGLEPAKP